MRKKNNNNVEKKISEVQDILGPQDLGVKSDEKISRRNFLRATGFSMTALLTACSKAPVENSIPFLIQPEEVTPGKAYWYASTSHACRAGCGVLVKNRDGRPIKIEGNPDHPVSQGGVCSVCQAGILELYDSTRILQPMEKGEEKSWEEINRKIKTALDKTINQGKEVVILTGTITSPSTMESIKIFKNKYKKSSHYQYDPISYSAILDAHEINYGIRILPWYRFNKADLILSLESDFLGTWLSPVGFTKDYRKRRNLSGESISRHIQIESRLTITGSKADQRIILSPVEIKKLVLNLEQELKGNDSGELAKKLALELKKYKRKSLVVSGMNDIEVQTSINSINEMLFNIGHTIDLKRTSYQFNGSDSDILNLMQKLEKGEVGVLMTHNLNPVYHLPDGKKFAELLESVETTISFSSRMDETAEKCSFICPVPHYLESWSDDEYNSGILSMTQPVIKKLGSNRSFSGVISSLCGYNKDELDLIRDYWKTVYDKRKTGNDTFNSWWVKLVHDGYAILKPEEKTPESFKRGKMGRIPKYSEEISLVAYSSVQMLDGTNCDNPWLQELPDPITKITWDNFASVSEKKAVELGLNNGDVVRLNVREKHIELPVHIQKGQHNNIIAVALGYGGKGSERFYNMGPKWIQRRDMQKKGSLIGTNVFPLIEFKNKNVNYSGIPVSVEKTNKISKLAYTQTYNTLKNPKNTSPSVMEIRPFIQETEFYKFKNNPKAGRLSHHKVKSLWKEDHPYKNHHWAMAIDLSACTGCSACVISCQVENNIPTVGKDEVLRRREMHWIRIDRYYSGEGDNIDVAFQPMFCQHCDHAPCEPVCPVLATVHSSEGLSQQVYNRCVGTRFCANNCPYKVRRFNWFDYSRENSRENMVLNPDVTVRSRGVMEKCSMCIQRIQEGKIESKSKGRTLRDGDIKLACEQSCPADAIVFGDLNDPESRISRLAKDPRLFHILEELNTRPSVGYLTIVRNRIDNKSKGENNHG